MMLSVSYHFYCQHVYDARFPIGRGLKPVLSISLRTSPLPMCVLNILSILKKKKVPDRCFGRASNYNEADVIGSSLSYTHNKKGGGSNISI